jgi:hypothetical protein
MATTMKISNLIALAVFGLALLNSSPAAVTLLPVASITGHQQGDTFDSNGSMLQIINGAGITQVNPNNINTWTHSTAWQSGWQGGNGGTVPNPTGWAVLDFGSIKTYFERMYLWNVNEVPDRGVRDFRIYSAISPTVTPPPRSGSQNPYSFGSGGWTLLGGTNTLPIGPGSSLMTPSGSFDLTSILSARYIGLEFINNYGSNFRTGLAEIAIVVPEPGKMSLIFLGGLGFLLPRRRKA